LKRKIKWEISMGTEDYTTLSKGCYVATSISSGVQIGYDEFEVRRGGGNVLVESKHVLCGMSGPHQISRFQLDPDWTPRRLEVNVEQGIRALVEFDETSTSMAIYDPKVGERRMSFPVGRQRAYFLLSGGLYFPLHLVRRFRFDDTQPQHFDIIPEGICQMIRRESITENGGTYYQIEARLMVAGVEDAIYMVLNDNRDLIRYRSRNQNLLVKLEEENNRVKT
jgi:hypothetical protein